jgi:tetratricopeptide (TPR) repeat protein
VLLGLADLYSAQKTQSASSRHELRQSAHEYCKLAESIGCARAAGEGGGGMVGAACAVAMNHLANQAFFAWVPVDAHAHGPSAQAAGGGGSGSDKMLFLSALGAEKASGGLVTSGDLVRVDGLFTAVVEDVIGNSDPVTGAPEKVCLILRDALPADMSSAGKLLRVELKEVNRVKDLTSRAFRGTSNKDVRGESLYLLGRMHHLLGELPAAYRHYEDALQLCPDMPLAQFAMGKRFLAEQDYPQALGMFERALAHNSEDKDTNAYIFLIKSMHKQELVPFEKLREVATGFHFETDLWLLQGQLRLRFSNEFGSALKCYTAALAALERQGRPAGASLLSNVAVLQVALGDAEGAARSARRGLSELQTELAAAGEGEGAGGKTHPFASDIPGHCNPTFLCHENDVFYSWAPAQGVSLEALSLQAYLAGAAAGAASMVTQDDDHKFGFSYFRCQSAEAVVSAGDHIVVGGCTLLAVQEVHCRGGECAFIGKGMQRLHPDSGGGSGSLSLEKKVPGVNFNEKTATLCYDYALILEERGSTNAASEVYRELIKLFPNYVECYLRLGRASLSRGRAREAMQWLQRGLLTAPGNPEVQSAVADLLASQGDTGRAVQTLNGLCRGGSDARAHVVQGNIRRVGLSHAAVSDQLKESYKFYYHVLEKDKRSSYGANGLGIILAEKQKLDAARDTFARVREANAPGSDIVNSACVNLAIVNLAQKKFVDSAQLLQSLARSLASTARPSEPPAVCGQVYLGNLLAMALVGNECFRDAIRAVSRVLFLNPTLLHSWYNLAFVREEYAVSSLRKVPKSSVVQGAMAELGAARSVFHSIGALLSVYDASAHVSGNCALKEDTSNGNINLGPFTRNLTVASDSLRNVACSLLSFDVKLIGQHESYCELSVKRADDVLQKQLREEGVENARRSELTEQHRQRLDAAEAERAREEGEREARRLENQEKGRLKATQLEQLKSSWATIQTPSEKKTKTKGGSKAAADEGVEYSDVEEPAAGTGTALDRLVDSDDDKESVSEEEVDFGSDASTAAGGSEAEGEEGGERSSSSKDKKKDKKDKKHKKDKKDKKEKKGDKGDRKAKRPREEGGASSGGGRLKKRAVMSDEEEDLFESTTPAPTPAPADGGLFDSDEDAAARAPAAKASRVIGDDSEGEEWNE